MKLKFIFVAMILLVLIGCGREADNSNAEIDLLAKQQISTFSTRQTKSGVLKWSLRADRAEFRDEITVVKSPKIDLFRDGNHVMTVTSDEGEIMKSRDLTLFGNVLLSSEEGKIFTEKIKWFDREEKLFAPEKSKIMRGKSVIFAEEIEYYLESESMMMKKVSGTFYPKDRKSDEF